MFGQTNVLTVAPAAKLTIKRGETVTAKIRAQLQPGYHCNSDKPADEYLIPLKLSWKADPLEAAEVTYPKPRMEKYRFSAEAAQCVFGRLRNHYKVQGSGKGSKRACDRVRKAALPGLQRPDVPASENDRRTADRRHPVNSQLMRSRSRWAAGLLTPVLLVSCAPPQHTPRQQIDPHLAADIDFNPRPSTITRIRCGW